MSLIIFFNGWGMNSELFRKMWDLESNEKYEIQFINYPYELSLAEAEKKYKNIYIIGWSFGVYYANCFLHKNPEFQKYESIAVNGTPEIVGRNGILERMIRFTKDTLTHESLLKFYENMDSRTSIKKTASKDVEDLKVELDTLLEGYTEQENLFKYAVISERDRIVPTKNMERYFNEKLEKSRVKRIDGGHFPFSPEFSIIDIIRMFKDEI